MKLYRNLLTVGDAELMAQLIEALFPYGEDDEFDRHDIGILISRWTRPTPQIPPGVGSMLSAEIPESDAERARRIKIIDLLDMIEADLLNRLKSGELVAQGILADQDKATDIPRGRWIAGGNIDFKKDVATFASGGDLRYFELSIRSVSSTPTPSSEGDVAEVASTPSQVPVDGANKNRGRSNWQTAPFVEMYFVLRGEAGRDLQLSADLVRRIKKRMSEQGVKPEATPSNRGIIEAIRREKNKRPVR